MVLLDFDNNWFEIQIIPMLPSHQRISSSNGPNRHLKYSIFSNVNWQHVLKPSPMVHPSFEYHSLGLLWFSSLFFTLLFFSSSLIWSSLYASSFYLFSEKEEKKNVSVSGGGVRTLKIIIQYTVLMSSHCKISNRRKQNVTDLRDQWLSLWEN